MLPVLILLALILSLVIMVLYGKIPSPLARVSEKDNIDEYLVTNVGLEQSQVLTLNVSSLMLKTQPLKVGAVILTALLVV